MDSIAELALEQDGCCVPTKTRFVKREEKKKINNRVKIESNKERKFGQCGSVQQTTMKYDKNLFPP